MNNLDVGGPSLAYLLVIYGGILAVFLPFYFLPSIIARQRRHGSLNELFLINLCLGWLIIGWAGGALLWAVLGQPKKRKRSYSHYSYKDDFKDVFKDEKPDEAVCEPDDEESPIQYTCPHCKRNVIVQADHIGYRMKCAKCAGSFVAKIPVDKLLECLL